MIKVTKVPSKPRSTHLTLRDEKGGKRGAWTEGEADGSSPPGSGRQLSVLRWRFCETRTSPSDFVFLPLHKMASLKMPRALSLA